MTPVLAPLLGNRVVTFALIGAAACQVWLTAMGLPAWRCPIKAALGISCPGCGLSTAVLFLIRGEWAAAVDTHLFAPVFLAGFVLMAVIGIMPERLHGTAVRWVEDLERRTGFVGLLLTGMILYWLLRMIWRL